MVRSVNFQASIVVPVLHQRDEWLEQSVRSATDQTAPTEVLVVRSETTPASNLRVLERLTETCRNLVVLIGHQPDSFPGAINQGIRAARSERIGLLMSDDWLDHAAVAECLHFATDIVSTGNNVYSADGRLNERASSDRSLAGFHACPTLQMKASYLQHFFLLRRQAVLDAGGLDEEIGNYPGIDDYDLIWTLLERGATVAVVAKRLYHYRDHEGVRLTLSDQAAMAENLKKILRKHRVGVIERWRILRDHRKWYGRTISSVLENE
jgi:GT2 family glycosyltransferase